MKTRSARPTTRRPPERPPDPPSPEEPSLPKEHPLLNSLRCAPQPPPARPPARSTQYSRASVSKRAATQQPPFPREHPIFNRPRCKTVFSRGLMKNRTRPTARATARPTAAHPIRPVLKNLRFQESSHCSTASVFKRAPSTPDPVSKTPARPPDRRPPDRLPDRPFDPPNTQELPSPREHPLLNSLRL